jgi:hypothetical protein
VRFGVWARHFLKVLGYYLSNDKRVVKGPGAPSKEVAKHLIAQGPIAVGKELDEAAMPAFSQSRSDANSVASQ